jgi:hypothetical protein
MLIFKKELLLTKSKKPIQVKKEIITKEFLFSYKDKNHKINYEQYMVDVTNIPNEEISKYVRNYFQQMLNKFNKTLRTGESKRILVNVYQIEIVTNLIKMSNE